MVSETVPKTKLVAHERVSKAKQGRSGLGLEAQRKLIEDDAKAKGATILGRFTEVESGRKNDRPELDTALQLARITGATLVIAKLDRLSRNAAFLLTLRGRGPLPGLRHAGATHVTVAVLLVCNSQIQSRKMILVSTMSTSTMIFVGRLPAFR